MFDNNQSNTCTTGSLLVVSLSFLAQRDREFWYESSKTVQRNGVARSTVEDVDSHSLFGAERDDVTR